MKSKADIIIIGAGMAGLTAAKLLQDSGFQVVVLEARGRVGGRTHTLELGGVWLDEGGSWIHFQKGNPLTYIAEANGFEVIEDAYEPFYIWDEQQKEAVGRECLDYMEAAEKAIEVASTYFRKDRGKEHALSFIKDYIQQKKWTPAKSRMVHFLFAALLEPSYATALENISLVDEQFLSKFEDEDETDALIRGGYRQLINRFQEGLNIQLSTPVQHINYSGDSIQIATLNGQYECQKVILTVPLGVLKKETIQFTPPLPASKREAIFKIGFGNLEKVMLRFEAAFWGNIKHAIYLGDNKNGLEFPSILDFTEIAGKPTLVVFYSAQFAVEMQAKSDAEILTATLNVLEKTFDQASLQPSHYHISRWSNDPYSYGSYTYSQFPDTASHIDALAAPIADKVFFAGEATSKKGQGYVHGALLSGIREAQRFGASTGSILGLEDYLNAQEVS